MKKITSIMLFIALGAFFGCAEKEKPAIKIGTIEISAPAFEQSFRESNLANAKDKEKARQEFLDTLIYRKLILKEAEETGVSKDPEFLKSIQLFWEQSLLKLMIDKRSRELFAGIKVSDQEVKNFYERHKEDSFANKELSKVYDSIKILLLKEKERAALQNWVDAMKSKTNIEIDYRSLGVRQK
jgi:hypothetical protein